MKAKWADPEYRKMRAEHIQDKWSTDPMSEVGAERRPYYTPLHPDWRMHQHTNTEAIEAGLSKLARKLLNRGIIPTQKAPKPKKRTPFNGEDNSKPIPKKVVDLLESDDNI